MNITPEVVEALAWLRNGWDGDNSERAITCLETLDDAGVFQAIDDFTNYSIEPIFCDRLPFPRMCSRLHRHAGECK